MKTYKRTRNALLPKRGFTLVELYIAATILALVIGTCLITLQQFRRFFLRGEEGTEVLREVTFFTEHFRNDFQNANSPDNLKITSDEISFPIYQNVDGATEEVTYRIEGKSLLRKIGNGFFRRLLNDSVISATWTLRKDFQSHADSQPCRTWIHFEGEFSKTDRTGKRTKLIKINTNFFPPRWNRKNQ